MFSDRDRYVLRNFLVLAVVATAAVGYYSWSVASTERQSRQKNIESLSEEVKAKEKMLVEIKKFIQDRDKIEVLVRQLAEKAKRLPWTVGAIEFYTVVGDCVRRTNISDMFITVRPPVVRGHFTEFPYQISCKARYHELGQFLTLIEQHSKQIIRIKSLEITNDLRRPSRHPVKMEMATFRFNQAIPSLTEIGK